jgi:hypothetical protein
LLTKLIDELMTRRLKFAYYAFEFLQDTQAFRVGQRLIGMLPQAGGHSAQRVNVALDLLTVGQGHVRRPGCRRNGLRSSYMSASSRPIRKSYLSRAAHSSGTVNESKDAKSTSCAASNLMNNEFQLSVVSIECMFEL